MSELPLTPVEAELLSMLNDDAYGLWEVDWWFNGAYPDCPREERVALVAKAIQSGHVTVFSGQFGESGEVLSVEAAIVSVRDLVNWRHRERPTLVFSAMTTEEGNEAVAQWHNPGRSTAP